MMYTTYSQATKKTCVCGEHVRKQMLTMGVFVSTLQLFVNLTLFSNTKFKKSYNRDNKQQELYAGNSTATTLG